MVNTPEIIPDANENELLNIMSLTLLLNINPAENVKKKFIMEIYIEEYNISFLCCIFFNIVAPITALSIAKIIISGLNPTAPLIKIQFNVLMLKDTL